MTDRPKTDAEKLDKKLDDALKDTFPGSDPVSSLEPDPIPGTEGRTAEDNKKRAP